MIWLFFRKFGANLMVVVGEIKKTMNAGSSLGTGISRAKGFVIPIAEPPVVEIDTEATAAYIRLRTTDVTRTEPFGSEHAYVMIDFDAGGEVVGIEVVGQQEFNIHELIKLVPIEADDAVLHKTHYVSADLQVA